jgi:single-stranded-DNA-specific exonuclease
MVLAGRGLCDPAAAREFLECSGPLPDPFLFADMPGAVGAILAKIDQGHRIVVHGDYDADGITATALLVQGLRGLGADVDWYLPSRFHEGYGLSRTAVEAIVADKAAMLITVDCGVNYPDEVAMAREAGLEVVVVDHHEPGPRLPECHLIHRAKGEYPDVGLCGVGLALKVMHALHIERLGAEPHRLPSALAQSLDLVAIGTVADLAALRGENRYYVREGLKLLNLGERVGLRELAQVSSCAGAIDSGSVAFRLAPRLNAAGRLSDASPPLRLLLTEDQGEARTLAASLHELNGARQDLERTMFETAQQQVEALAELPSVLVMAGSDWHEGVVGIVSSRIVEQYHRPTVLFSIRDGVAKGSGRSIPGYDLLSGLTACSHMLSVYGGHAQAAGLTMQADKLDAFREALQRHVDSVISPADLVPTYRADAFLTAEELGVDTAQALARLEPFGSGNPRPRFLLVDTALQGVGRTRNGLHLKCHAQVGGVRISAIGFGMGRSPDIAAGDTQFIVGAQLRADEWQGCARAQLVLERIEPTQSCSDCVPICRQDFDSTFLESEVACKAEVGAKPSDSVRGGEHAWPSSARDLRDHQGRVTALAQVLGTQESVAVFTTSAADTFDLLRSRLPIQAFVAEEMVCVDRTCSRVTAETPATSRLAIVEWDAAAGLAEIVKGPAHAIVFDPPFRPRHMAVISELAGKGTSVHLLYGDQERKATSQRLRYLVHPRFAMVCLYKAMKSVEAAGGELFSAAGRIAWDEARVVLTRQDLRRAQGILQDLGLERLTAGRAKLDARENATYREAEAEYEECVRLCLTL